MYDAKKYNATLLATIWFTCLSRLVVAAFAASSYVQPDPWGMSASKESTSLCKERRETVEWAEVLQQAESSQSGHHLQADQ